MNRVTPMPSTTIAESAKASSDMRRAGTGAASCHKASVWTGRGLPTSGAETMSLESPEAGAWGTTSFWKQVGQSSCVPLVLESAVMCCPQTGHANLNSLMIARRTIPYLPGADNDIFWQRGGPGSVQELEEKAVAANVRRRNSIAKRNPPPHVGGYVS